MWDSITRKISPISFKLSAGEAQIGPRVLVHKENIQNNNVKEALKLWVILDI